VAPVRELLTKRLWYRIFVLRVDRVATTSPGPDQCIMRERPAAEGRGWMWQPLPGGANQFAGGRVQRLSGRTFRQLRRWGALENTKEPRSSFARAA
jgi:hypothetical protein